jgi:hypothetical protein
MGMIASFESAALSHQPSAVSHEIRAVSAHRASDPLRAAFRAKRLRKVLLGYGPNGKS